MSVVAMFQGYRPPLITPMTPPDSQKGRRRQFAFRLEEAWNLDWEYSYRATGDKMNRLREGSIKSIGQSGRPLPAV
jgi:hypothetical protein